MRFQHVKLYIAVIFKIFSILLKTRIQEFRNILFKFHSVTGRIEN